MIYNIQNNDPSYTPEPEVAGGLSDSQLELARDNFRWHWSDVALTSVVSVVIMLAGVAGFALLQHTFSASHEITTSTLLSAATLGLEFVALVGCVYLLGMRRRHVSWRAVGLRHIPGKWPLIALGLSLLIIPVGALATYAVVLIFKLPLVNAQLPTLAPHGLSWLGVGVLIFLGGIAVPFAEELFFRGLIYTFLRQRWGVWVGVLASSLIFAIAHMNVMIGAMAFCLGLFCAFTYERSKSLWASYIIHAVSNTLKLVFVYVMLASTTHIPLF
ncbi:CPBP family intramembrane metalloprotease [Ktedonosporobacter rubrisoli]|uniref:CPBP family intramembrane metalloprotease n=1 Tax=Ktedonosporobacter rubrisoli TaxID=2509675 RepID=A0A4P6JPK3_KTERU|nr:type II CAAX endopeptidase family protein [Ktedonosporobacter rubrisoli]QBD77070.1 CPBP family intramembrane metalloprotease [Ktedonosporobacter rubrisoli]